MPSDTPKSGLVFVSLDGFLSLMRESPKLCREVNSIST
jgi:hypothetical protein